MVAKNYQHVIPAIEKYHVVPDELLPYPQAVVYAEQTSDENNVYFVDYDMSQVNILLLAKGPSFDKTLMPPARLFGEYFGGGLSSIVFQEIREARGFAYSAFSAFATPSKVDQSHFIYGFVGTQSDKLKEATDALLELMNDMPIAQKQFDLARNPLLKKLKQNVSLRPIFSGHTSVISTVVLITISGKMFTTIAKKPIWKPLENFSINTSKAITIPSLFLGNKNEVDLNVLGELGTVKELTLEEIFNY